MTTNEENESPSEETADALESLTAEWTTNGAPEGTNDKVARFLAHAEQVETRVRGIERHAAALAKQTGAYLTPAPRTDALNLNEATPADLRSLGLTPTQAARLIAHRDARGGIASLEDIDAVAGLPAELRVLLRDRTTV